MARRRKSPGRAIAYGTARLLPLPARGERVGRGPQKAKLFGVPGGRASFQRLRAWKCPSPGAHSPSKTGVNALMMRADPGSSPGQALSPQAGRGKKKPNAIALRPRVGSFE